MLILSRQIHTEELDQNHKPNSKHSALCSLALVLAGLLVARAAFLELRKRGNGRPGTPPMTAGKRAPVSIAKYSRRDLEVKSSTQLCFQFSMDERLNLFAFQS